MHRSLRLGFSALALVVAACGGSPDSASSASSIDALVQASGNINTDKTPDPAPVVVKQLPDATVDTATAQFSCKETQYSLTKVPDKFVALNPNADVLWPGSLVQGASMESGLLNPIPVERAPGTIVLTIASGGSNAFSKTMDKPSLSSAIQAQNDILANYTGATPAKFSYESSEIFSMDQLAVAVDANVKGSTWSVAAALSFDEKDAKSRYLIQFTQEYFTMAFEPPAGAHAAFAPTVTADDLKPYAGEGNPPVYVASVTYGRIFYLLFESSASSKDLSASVRAAFSVGAVEADGGVSADYKSVVNSATVRAYGIGGDAAAAIAAATGGYKLGDPQAQQSQVDAIKSFLTSGASFSAKSPGVPISYMIRYLGDSSEVKLALTTEYTAKDCTALAKGCDGVVGSKKTVDACGVCGGDGSSCAAGCPAINDKHQTSNGAFVIFNVPAGKANATHSFHDGTYHEYHFGSVCHRIWWTGVSYTCTNASWTISSAASFSYDANCYGDAYSSASDGVTCGWN